MTEDPVRLLSQKGDAFAASLLESAREGDRDTARSHKALVLGAASGAVLGGAAITPTRIAARPAPLAPISVKPRRTSIPMVPCPTSATTQRVPTMTGVATICSSTK